MPPVHPSDETVRDLPDPTLRTRGPKQQVNVRPQPPVPYSDQSEPYNQLAQHAERIRQRYAKLTKEQAFARALEENPHLYEQDAIARGVRMSNENAGQVRS